MTGNGIGRFEALFAELAAIGRDPSTGAYRRLAWTDADREARAWFRSSAEARGLDVHADRNGNLSAWWGTPGPGAIGTGSHLDTVPGGGAWDGALGLVSAFLAVEDLRSSGLRPSRPLAIGAFVEEEGGRFGIPTLGSRLASGQIEPATVLDRRDAGGNRLRDAMAQAGVDPTGLGMAKPVLGGVETFIELHVEQGRHLETFGVPIGIGTGVWPHGRWQIGITGEANHAGTTRLEDRRDPTLALAAAITESRRAAEETGGVATMGRVIVSPNASNAVPERVEASLDVRAETETAVEAILGRVRRVLEDAASGEGVTAEVVRESWSPAVRFDEALAARVGTSLDEAGIPWAPIPTAAGHDAATLAAVMPTAMIFVRNPTGISHAPAEAADPADAATGVEALVAVLRDLATG